MRTRHLRTITILAACAVYVSSYGICRRVYQQREDDYITKYDQRSITGQVCYALHTPLWVLDAALTGRHTDIGKWRPRPKDLDISQ
jgi:hypothetical protein